MNKSIILITGPSGSGKSAVISQLMNTYKQFFNLSFCISYTTRTKRKHEVEGKDYFFVSRNKFNMLIKENAFVEYVQYANNYYGTPKSQIEKLMNENKVIILDVDVVGAKNIHNIYKNASIMIYITVENLNDLKLRLSKRKTETETSIKKRIDIAKKIDKNIDCFQYVVVNKLNKFENTVNNIKNILKKECSYNEI